MKEFLLGDALVFSDAGETALPEATHFAKTLNNSFGLTESQFGILHSIANGKVDTTAEELIIPTPPFPDCYFMFQPGQKAKDKDRPPFRDHILAICVDVVNKRMRRIFIRAKRGSPTALEQLMGYYRPMHFIRDLMEQLEKGAQITTIDRKPRPPHKGKPGDKPSTGKPAQPRTDNKPRPSNASSPMGERWPSQPDRESRDPADKKDHRHVSE